MGEGLGSREPISCYSSILKTVETVPGATAIVDPTRSAWFNKKLDLMENPSNNVLIMSLSYNNFIPFTTFKILIYAGFQSVLVWMKNLFTF